MGWWIDSMVHAQIVETMHPEEPVQVDDCHLKSILTCSVKVYNDNYELNN
jgi:hypothetical protein